MTYTDQTGLPLQQKPSSSLGDRTIICTVVQQDPNQSSKYKLKYQNTELIAYAINGATYSEDDTVLVLVPENDFQKDKFITCLHPGSTGNKAGVKYLSPADKIIVTDVLVENANLATLLSQEAEPGLLPSNYNYNFNGKGRPGYLLVSANINEAKTKEENSEEYDLPYGFNIGVLYDSEIVKRYSFTSDLFYGNITQPYGLMQSTLIKLEQDNNNKFVKAIYTWPEWTWTGWSNLTLAIGYLASDLEDAPNEIAVYPKIEGTELSYGANTANADLNLDISAKILYNKKVIGTISEDNTQYGLDWFVYTPGHVASGDKETQLTGHTWVLQDGSHNSFDFTVNRNPDLSSTNVKAVYYKLEDGLYTKLAEGTIVCDNTARVVDKTAAEAAASGDTRIKITVEGNDGSSNFFVYGNDGKLAENVKFSIKPEFRDGHTPSSGEIKWYIPKGQQINQPDDLDEDEDSDYWIKTVSYTNTFPSLPLTLSSDYGDETCAIRCEVIQDGEYYACSRAFRFGRTGSGGTKYRFNLVPSAEAITIGQDNFTVKMSLQDDKGNEITEVNWPNVIQQDSTTQTYKFNEGYLINDTSPSYFTPLGQIGNTITFRIATEKTITNYNGITLLKVQLTNFAINETQTIDLVAYWPIAVRSNDAYINFSGCTRVVYDQTGSNPTYSKTPYGLEKIGVTISPTIELTQRGNTELGLSQDESLLPADNLSSGDTVGCIAVTDNGTVVWKQPILVTQNQYFSSLINAWNGLGVSIDNGNGTILSSMLAAGRKEDNNTFTGVLMGDVRKTDSPLTKSGLYGFKAGARRFELNDAGEFYVGTGADNHIQLQKIENTDNYQFSIRTNSFITGATSVVNPSTPADYDLWINSSASAPSPSENIDESARTLLSLAKDKFKVYYDSDGTSKIRMTFDDLYIKALQENPNPYWAKGFKIDTAVYGKDDSSYIFLIGTTDNTDTSGIRFSVQNTTDRAQRLVIKTPSFTLDSAATNILSLANDKFTVNSSGKITLSGWTVDSSSLYNGTWASNLTNLTFISTGTSNEYLIHLGGELQANSPNDFGYNWVFGCAPEFGVKKDGRVFLNKLYINSGWSSEKGFISLNQANLAMGYGANILFSPNDNNTSGTTMLSQLGITHGNHRTVTWNEIVSLIDP